MHRLMMTSATYRQASAITPELAKLDPENALYSRMPLVRLDAEALYDSLLLVAGRLDETRVGPADAVQVRPRRAGDASRHRDGLAAARLRAADAQADPDAPGDLRLPADEPQLHRAPRLDGRPAGAAPDEQRHGRAARRATSPSGSAAKPGTDPARRSMRST